MREPIELITESGKCIKGLLVADTPWIYWQISDLTIRCEHCETVAELPAPLAEGSLDDNDGPAQISSEFQAFIEEHERCGLSNSAQTVSFGPDNKLDYAVYTLDETGLVAVQHTGLPPDAPFTLHAADAFGAWLTPPPQLLTELGGDLGMVRVFWRTGPPAHS